MDTDDDESAGLNPPDPLRSTQLWRGVGADGVCRRQAVSSAWGKYWRTIVRCPAGEGERRLVFTAELPHAGRWELALHNPDRVVPGLGEHTGFTVVTGAQFLFGELGAYDIRLHGVGEPMALEFDGASAAPGWRRLGEFDLGAGTVRVSMSSRTDGEIVVADAIRWTAANASAPAGG